MDERAGLATTAGGNAGAIDQQECPLCHSRIRPRVYCGGQYLGCPVCSVGWTSPPPAVSHTDYVEDRVNTSENYLAHESIHRPIAAGIANFVCRLTQPPRVGRSLDVGCSVGYLVEELQRLGYDAEGVEPDHRAGEAARKRGLKVREGVLDLSFGSHEYALVTMSHVLEHVEEPLALLSEVHRILQPGGLVILVQPNYQGLVPQLWPDKWYGWQPTMHFWHFTPQSLEYALGQARFRVTAVDHNSLDHRWPARGEWGNARLVGRQALLRMTSRCGRIIKSGDQIYVAARAV